jgi:chemotaxis protein methyltransferase CheR
LLPTPNTVPSLSPNVDYGYLRQVVYEQSQNVLDPSRDYLFETRLVRLLRGLGLLHTEELVQLLQLRRDPALERAVAEAMTINETSFFRDGRPFDLLRNELLPKLIESRRAARSLRIWSAACSTGQEAYSVAMLVRESFPQLAGWNVRIEGTDFSAEVVHRCQLGNYHRIEMNRGLPARNIVRFFERSGEDWTAKREIRSLCNFRQANLCGSQLPFHDPFDLIFLRNVMLYFSQETRKRLLARVHRLLPADGLLILGASEHPSDPALWTTVFTQGTCYYRPRASS